MTSASRAGSSWSRVAVVTEDGTVVLNKNVVNGSEPMLRLIGELPSGTPVSSLTLAQLRRLAGGGEADEGGVVVALVVLHGAGFAGYFDGV